VQTGGHEGAERARYPVIDAGRPSAAHDHVVAV